MAPVYFYKLLRYGYVARALLIPTPERPYSSQRCLSLRTSSGVLNQKKTRPYVRSALTKGGPLSLLSSGHVVVVIVPEPLVLAPGIIVDFDYVEHYNYDRSVPEPSSSLDKWLDGLLVT